MKKLRLAIAGFTACSGCQLTLLNCENELLAVAEKFEFAYFPLAISPAKLEESYDAALVEGCVSTEAEADFLRLLRQRSRVLIAIGSCAAWGGVPAMPMISKVDQELREPAPEALHTLVQVDATLYGCPPEKTELLALLSGLLRGTLPAPVEYPVCTECKIRENLCLLTEHHQLCLGSLTVGGCNARCPSLSVACEGCRGPLPEADYAAALACFTEHGHDAETVMKRLGRFHAGCKP